MMHAITVLNPYAVAAAVLAAIALGFVWYIPLFGKAWMAEMKFTPETMKEEAGSVPRIMAGALLLTSVSTVALAALLSVLHVSGAGEGAEVGLLVGVALVAARQGNTALFERRTFKHVMIVSGYDVAVFALQGAILGVWR
jgi:hypothetical protein